jgi:predicted amidophosphoribosyltransferase
MKGSAAEKRKLEMAQLCPGCLQEVRPNSRYPRYVCETCVRTAAGSDGRLVEFTNADNPAGCVGRYSDTGEHYPSVECFVQGIRCHAREAHLGGVVVQAVE